MRDDFMNVRGVAQVECTHSTWVAKPQEAGNPEPPIGDDLWGGMPNFGSTMGMGMRIELLMNEFAESNSSRQIMPTTPGCEHRTRRSQPCPTLEWWCWRLQRRIEIGNNSVGNS